MKDEDPRYEVVNTEIKKILYEIGKDIKASLPEGWGFTLFLISYGQNGSTFYMSSINREDMQRALREFLIREGGQ